jgi:hypothetical protein
VLPILESLTNGPAKASRKTGYGKAPSVLVLLPTRELANQVIYDNMGNIQGIFALLTVSSRFSNIIVWINSRWLLTLKFMVELWG